MTQPLPVPLAPSVYRRLLRLSGGRAAVPKGGSLDLELIETLNLAVHVGAIRARLRMIRLIGDAIGSKASRETTDALVLLRERLIATSINDYAREGT